MTASYTDVVQTARDYYNSDDAETFYSTVWGGEDIHIGLYESDEDTIAEASRRTVEQLAQQLGRLDDSMHVLDMGSGYGGTARYLAEMTGCHVTGLNLSEVENQRARQLNEERGLQERVRSVDGSFEAAPPASSSEAPPSEFALDYVALYEAGAARLGLNATDPMILAALWSRTGKTEYAAAAAAIYWVLFVFLNAFFNITFWGCVFFNSCFWSIVLTNLILNGF